MYRKKEAETYYLATVEGDQPRVRPFGTAHIFEGKLYIQTGKVKDVVMAKLQEQKINQWIKDKQKSTYIRINEGWGDCDFEYPGWIK